MLSSSFAKCAAVLVLQIVLAGATRKSSRLRGQLHSDQDIIDTKRARVVSSESTFTRRKEFELVCTSELRKKATDGMLSQVEFAEFLYDYCKRDPSRGLACRPGKDELFPSLSSEIQALFVAGLCPANAVERLECLEFLNNGGEEFGYTEEADELCASTFPLLEPSGLIVLDGSTTAKLPEPAASASSSAAQGPDSKPEKVANRGGMMTKKRGMNKKPVVLPTEEEEEVQVQVQTSSGSVKIADPPRAQVASLGDEVDSDASSEPISIASKLGISAAAFAVVALAVCSASKRRRDNDGKAVVFCDPALDGDESIVSESSAALELDVQKEAPFSVTGKAQGNSKRPVGWFRLTNQSDEDAVPGQPNFRTFPKETTEVNTGRAGGSFRSPALLGGFFRRQSARLRGSRYTSGDSIGDLTFEDESTVEGKVNEINQVEAEEAGMRARTVQGKEGSPTSRRAWRSHVAQPFFSVFGARNEVAVTTDNTDQPPKKAMGEVMPEVLHPTSNETMSRSEWKRTLMESYDDETSLGSFAEVSAELRKHFKDFDSTLTNGFVDLSVPTFESRAYDDASLGSGRSVNLDQLQSELASCDNVDTDSVGSVEPDGASSGVEVAPLSPTVPGAGEARDVMEQSPVSPLAPIHQRADHRLVDDKPWRKQRSQSAKNSSRSKTMKLAKKFESTRLGPAAVHIDLTQVADDPLGVPDTADDSSSAIVPFDYNRATDLITNYPVEDNTGVAAESTIIDDNVVPPVSTLRGMFERQSSGAK